MGIEAVDAIADTLMQQSGISLDTQRPRADRRESPPFPPSFQAYLP